MSDYNPVITAPVGANKKPKRVGRGSSSGHGTTAGRGNKGQQSRSGSKQPYVGFEGGQMPLYRRIARRGFNNAVFAEDVASLNIRDFEKAYSDGDTVDKATLVEKGFVSKNVSSVKVLGIGDVSKKLNVKVDRISQSAKEKIEKAGGTVEAVAGVSRKARNASHAKQVAAKQERAAKAASAKPSSKKA